MGILRFIDSSGLLDSHKLLACEMSKLDLRTENNALPAHLLILVVVVSLLPLPLGIHSVSVGVFIVRLDQPLSQCRCCRAAVSVDAISAAAVSAAASVDVVIVDAVSDVVIVDADSADVGVAAMCCCQ